MQVLQASLTPQKASRLQRQITRAPRGGHTGRWAAGGSTLCSEHLDSSLGSFSNKLVTLGKLLNLSDISFLLFELDNLLFHFMLNYNVVEIKTFHYQPGPEMLVTSGI